MKQINAFRAYLTLCILALASLFGGVNAFAENVEAVYKHLQFGPDYNSKKVSGYTSPWTVTVDGFTADIANFNNNNNEWEYIKCGSKSAKSFATIITSQAIDKSITKVVVTVGAYTTGSVTGNKATLTVASDKNFTQDVETVEANLGEGQVTHYLANPRANCYYKLSYDCEKLKNGALQIDRVEYYASSLPAPDFSIDPTSQTIRLGDTFTVSAATNSTGAITYSSSNSEIATVDEATGVVTAVKEGTATITAKVAATEIYASKTATCEVTVIDPNKPAEVVTPMQFKKITAPEQLIDGAQYVLVCESKEAVAGNKNGDFLTVISAEVSDGTIAVNNDFGVFTLKKNETNYSLGLAGKWIGNSGSNGGNTTTLLNDTDVDEVTKWTISFKPEGDVTVQSVKTTRVLCYNQNKSNPRFSPYASSNYNGTNKDYPYCQLYRLETNATINENIGYTTFYTDKSYQLPEGLTAYAITEAKVAGAVTMTQAYAAGENVPANTALLIEGEAGTYGMPVLNKEVDAYTGENMLEGTRSAEGYTRSARENVLYYKLTLNLKDGAPGFYWGAENGAAFCMKNPNTAYLAVPNDIASAAGFRIIMDGTTTGIDTVTTPVKAENAIYTLAGVRVNAQSTKSLPKGIYIVNGQKMLVK